ncbi:MAG: LLM class flavin-dependent oxidoreductase [Pseudomonadota bacterium]
MFLLLDHAERSNDPVSELYGFVLDHAERADSLGYDSLWLAEHHYGTLGTVPNPAVLLSAIAARTKRLRVGPSVAILPYRQAVFAAEDYAMVDIIAEGRLNMGVGAGSQRDEIEGLGIDFDSRWDAYRQNLSTLRGLWANASLNVSPRQQPLPPFYVATMNETNARDAGHNGDGVLTLLTPGARSLDALARLIAAHQEGLSNAGYHQDTADVVVVQFAQVGTNDEAVCRQSVAALQQLLTVMSGDGRQAQEAFDAMRAGSTGCFGTPTKAQATIEDLAAFGVRHVAFVTRFGDLNADMAHETLRLLAPKHGEQHDQLSMAG